VVQAVPNVTADASRQSGRIGGDEFRTRQLTDDQRQLSDDVTERVNCSHQTRACRA
jgi:hypothetical protein